MNSAILVALIAGIIVLCGFFIWLFWTVAGMLMEIFKVTQYGWPLQLVLFLVMWGICGGIGGKVRS